MKASLHTSHFKLFTHCSFLWIYSTRFKIFLTVIVHPETKQAKFSVLETPLNEVHCNLRMTISLSDLSPKGT